MSSLDTLESIGVDCLRTEDSGHMTSLVYSDEIQFKKGADRVAAFYQRKPDSVRLYSTCCDVYLGIYAGALKVAMLSSALFEPGDYPAPIKVNTGKLPDTQKEQIENGHKSAPFGFTMQFLGAALFPFNGHKKTQWVPDAVMENVSSSEELSSRS